VCGSKGYFLLAAVTVAAALTVPAGASAKGLYVCDGPIGVIDGFPATYYPSTIDANVDVPAGATCSMFLATVTGNVTVEGSLFGTANTFEKNVVVDGGVVGFPVCFSLICPPRGPTNIAGNFTAFNPAGLTLDVTDVAGNTTVDSGTGYTEVAFSTVSGQLSFSNNSGFIPLFASNVGKNLQFSGNTGGITIGFVTVAGNLSCDSNGPVPALSNVTASKEDGQCAGL
jgi:hypothetical protein